MSLIPNIESQQRRFKIVRVASTYITTTYIILMLPNGTRLIIMRMTILSFYTNYHRNLQRPHKFQTDNVNSKTFNINKFICTVIEILFNTEW